MAHLQGMVGKEGGVWRPKTDASVAASPCRVHAVGRVSWWPVGCWWPSWSRWRGKVLLRWKVATHRSKMGKMLWSIVDRWREVVGWMVEGRRSPMWCCMVTMGCTSVGWDWVIDRWGLMVNSQGRMAWSWM